DFSVEAGKGRDPDNLRPLNVFLNAQLFHSVPALPHHGKASGGVYIEHVNSESGSSKRSPGNSIRNIMELEVEKYPLAFFLYLLDNVRTGSDEKLKADLEDGCLIPEPVHNIKRLVPIRHIECYNKLIFPRKLHYNLGRVIPFSAPKSL